MLMSLLKLRLKEISQNIEEEGKHWEKIEYWREDVFL